MRRVDNKTRGKGLIFRFQKRALPNLNIQPFSDATKVVFALSKIDLVIGHNQSLILLVLFH